MRIDRIELIAAKLPLVRPFRTSSSVKDSITHILVRVESDGYEGWGECACPVDPFYCPETVETCWHILRDFLGPIVIRREAETVPEYIGSYAPLKGNRFAKAGLGMALWDLFGKVRRESLASMLGATRREIEAGVSLGIESDTGRLFALIDQYVAEGYRRIKLKIGPGHDVEVVRAVRERFPDLTLQVDANSAYTLDDLDTMLALDEFGLAMIEQPLAHDDIIDHAMLQARIKTPICLDESLHSTADVRKAITIGACGVVNVKVGRVGGVWEARSIQALTDALGVPAWCGGMHEFGIGRAANLAVAALPGFTLPSDISGSDKYYAEDLIDPPIRAVAGLVPVPDAPGLGVEPDFDRLERARVRSETIRVRKAVKG